MVIFLSVLGYLACVNLITYRAFARDKKFAIQKQQRTPEKTLLFWARIGGWTGAKVAQRRLRHKSYKQPFGYRLNIIGMVHAMTVVAVALTASLLTLSPPSFNIIRTATLSTASREVPPVGGPVAISLRPPAVRPAKS